MSKQSIFLRIYAGLVILVVLVAVFGYLLVQIINYQRMQEYRASLTDGISFVLSEGMARNKTAQQRMNYMADISALLYMPIYYIDADKIELTRTEKSRLENQQAIVQYDVKSDVGYVIMAIPDEPEHLLYMKVEGGLGERQLKALPSLVSEYLAYYPGREKEQLEKIKKHFSYEIGLKNINELALEADQISKLRSNQVVILFRGSAKERGTVISIISVLNAHSNTNEVLVMGPVPMFNWMPFKLAASITLLSMLILCLGVYGLIVPMQRKLRQVNTALNIMQKGDMSVRVPVEGNDELAHLAASYNSMSDHIQRLIESQRELMRAVSHELRTPVARIRFGMEMLVDEEEFEYRQQQVEMIDKDIEALNTLIDEIMTYAKLEQGVPALNFEELRLFDILNQVVVETEGLKTNKQIELQASSAEWRVDAERRYLHRVVQNLVGNAVRYCDDRVLVSGGINEEGMAYICVEDDGPGIPEEDRQRVFEAFARLDDSRTRASGGYGLGLSIVNRIAYWFKGTVRVDRSPKLGGARFIMEWPAKRFNKKRVKHFSENDD